MYAFGCQKEDNSLDFKETYDGLISGHENNTKRIRTEAIQKDLAEKDALLSEFMRTSKVKLQEASNEQKTGHEDDVKKIRTEASKKDLSKKDFLLPGCIL